MAFVFGVLLVVLILVGAGALVVSRWGDSDTESSSSGPAGRPISDVADPTTAPADETDAESGSDGGEVADPDSGQTDTDASSDASGEASSDDGTDIDASGSDSSGEADDAAGAGTAAEDESTTQSDISGGADAATDDTTADSTVESEADDTAGQDSEEAEPEGAEAPSDGAADASSDAADAPVTSTPSRAVFRDGVVILEGAVPTQEVSDEIESLAVEILGEEGVVNNHVIDPSVPAPTTGNLVVEETIAFAPGSFWLPEPVPAIMLQGLALMQVRPTTTILIVGHTDSIGDEESNQRLSQARAERVKDWFVDNGIDESRLDAQGLGESEPVADNSTEEGRRANRRIEFIVENVLAPEA